MAEKWLTAGLDGGFYNLPLTADGEELLPMQAIERAKAHGTLGTPFATAQEATAARQALEAPSAPAPEVLTPVPIKAPDNLAMPSYADQDGATAIIQLGKRREQERLEAFRQEHLAAPTPATKGPLTKEVLVGMITDEAKRQGVDPALALAVATQESYLNPNAIGDNGKSLGLFQLQRAAAIDAGINPDQRGDMATNIKGGVAFLRLKLAQSGGNVDQALLRYNGGGDPNYVQNVRRFLPGGPTETAAALQPAQTRATGQDFLAQARAAGATPAQLTDAERLMAHEARLQQQPQGSPFVDMGVGAVQNVRSATTGFFRAIGSAFRTPANVGEALAPILPEAVTTAVPQAQVLPGISLGTLTTIWQGLGQAAEHVAQATEVPEAHKTFANKLSESAGALAAYWIPAIASGGSTLVLTGVEAFSEANEVYEALKPVVGQDEAAKRAGITAATNVLVLGLTNKLGLGEHAKLTVRKLAGGIVSENVQEVVQYETQRRQFWVPSNHPKAAMLKAHGWQEADGKVYQPFSAKSVGEILAISSILGGSNAFVQGMLFANQGTPAQVEERVQRVQAQEALAVSQEIPQSVVREGYGAERTPATALSTPELALPQTAVRGPAGSPLKVVHGTGAVFQQFAVEKQGSGEGSNLWGPGFYFAEDPAIASDYAHRKPQAVWRVEDVRRIYTPGAIVEQSFGGGRDQVLAFDETEGGQWSVTVQEIDAAGKPVGRPRSHSTPPTPVTAPNTRPVYLDIRRPFDTTRVMPWHDIRWLYRMAGIPTTDETPSSEGLAGREVYELLTVNFAHDKAQVNRFLAQQGYDGIFHIGDRDGRVWIAFRPEQVIPAFDIDALLELARLETQALAEEAPAPEAAVYSPSQTLGRWRALLQAEVGGVPLPGGQPEQQPLAQRLQDVEDLIAVEEAMGDNPQLLAQLQVRKAQLEAQLAAEQATPPQEMPPPVPQEAPSALAQYLEETTPEGAQNLRDTQGRWRLPLKNIPSAELELQDFIRQQGGIRLAEETDVPGELRALVTRRETGMAGLQNNASGMSLQGIAERAAELGFIATADKTAMLEAMDRSIRQGETVYSMQATGQVAGITDAEAEPEAPRPQRPAPPPLSGQGPGRPVVILTESQVRMQQRAASLSNFLVEDRVDFRLPSGETRQGRVVETQGTEVTIAYGRRGSRLTVDVLGEEMRSVRLRLTKAQMEAEAAGILDLPQVLTEQIESILHTPERELTGRITGINFDRIQTPAHVKQYIADIMAASSTYIQEARRGVISRAELLAMAQENIAKKRFTIDTLLQRQPGQTFSPEDTLAARLIAVSVAEEFAARVQRFSENPTPETEQQMLQFIPLSQEIFAQWSGLTAEQGRALGAFVPDAYGNVQYIEEVGDRLQTLPLGVTTEEFATHLGGLKTTEEMVAALKHVPTWGDLFLAGLYGMKLMRFTTDAKNVLGSAAAYLWKTTVRGLSTRLPGDSGDVATGEATAMLYGWWRANMMMFKLWQDLSDVKLTDRFQAVATAAADRIGFDTLFDRLKTEGLSGQQTITAANIRARAGQSGMMGRYAGQLLIGGPRRSALVDMIGAFLHFSGAKLNFEDTVAKVYNYMGEGYAQAYREAMSQETPLDGEALSNWMDDYVLNMKGTVKEKASQEAFDNTLTERLGPRAATIENFLNATPALRLWMLFYRTPMNAARWAIRNSPVGFLAQKNQEALRAGGADADLARASIALGTTVLTMGVVSGLMGTSTGSYPWNRETRKLLEEDARQPEYANWIPGLNRWVTFDWVDPVSSIFGMGTDIAGMIKHGEFRDNDWWENVVMVFGAAALALGRNVLSRTWMQGARDAFDTMVPRKGEEPGAMAGKVQRLGMQQVRGLFPAPVTYAKDIADPVIREVAGLMDTLKEGVPFLSKSLPPSHNLLGYIRHDKDMLGPDYISPIYAPKYDPKPIFAELGRLIETGHLTIPDAPRRLKLGGETVELTAEEVSQFQLMRAGGNPDVTGKPGRLEEALSTFIKSQAYQKGLSDEGRAVEVRGIIMEFHDDAREQLMKSLPRLQQEQRENERAQQQRRLQRPTVGAGTP